MTLRYILLCAVAHTTFLSTAQLRIPTPTEAAEAALEQQGIPWATVGDLRIADTYTSRHNGVTHTWFRQQFQGVDIWNSEVVVHQQADGSVLRVTHNIVPVHAQGLRNVSPGLHAADALMIVLQRDGVRMSIPRQLAVDDVKKVWTYEGADFSDESPFVQLALLPQKDGLVLVWNVNYYMPDGSHWWNVRIDASTGAELERNDWVAQCAFDHDHAKGACVASEHGSGEVAAPAAPNDYNVYGSPVESPNYGSRSLRNAPWTLAPSASPFGWHDTDGAAGAEYTITRGNNVLAQEDANGNNGIGYSPSGGAGLDFDFPLDLANAPSTYQDAAITNLFYWNNIIHDVFYQYGFDEAGGNFQSNNYGNGGAGNDYVLADAQDGSGTNNANFGTPADGSSPRMQMFLWTAPTPDRDGDFDNGIVTHEYGHGISNRLVGGPSNVNCLGNAEQMGEGWSDYFGLMMTMEPGDAGTDARGIGTYALNQPATGIGIRPAPYSTSFGTNNYTYASTNNTGLSQPHGIGFVWCTMLWEMTWELIGIHGYDPDIYNGSGGNNIALQLVIDGLKLTPCNPGFVDGRDAILAADMANNGGANQTAIWAAFARRGLGFGASQGSSSSRTDQTETFSIPVNNNVAVTAILAPPAGPVFACTSGGSVQVTVRNNGLMSQGGFPVSYRLDGGATVTETFVGTLTSGASATHTFAGTLSIVGVGAHVLEAWTGLIGDQYVADDLRTNAITLNASAPIPFVEDAQGGVPAPSGWSLNNPDNSYTWEVVSLTNGPACASTMAWRLNHYAYSGSAQEDFLTSPSIDLTSSAGTRLKFDHAYVTYPGYSDGLRVEVSDDCGANWTVVYTASGAALETAPATSSQWVPSDCADWDAHDIDISAFDGGSIFVRFVSVNGFGNHFYMDNVRVESSALRLQIKVFLQGPYNVGSSLMNDDIRAANLLPNGEPYTALGYPAAGGGGETIAPAVLALAGNNAPVDWVRVELRASATPGVVSAARQAIVQRDGDIVSAATGGPIDLSAPTGDYHVAVRHRNHLGAMIASPIALNDLIGVVDLSLPATVTYGTDARKNEGGTMLLWCGNTVDDVELKYTGTTNDRDPILVAIGGILPTNTIAAYALEDVNMDGIVKYAGASNDRDPILVNVGGSVPTATRTEQLP
ncbi:MAG: M36 family metallopeptidase [Flavobacteriales bacterium]|nr:M36 family metallopeptidase [Flavobacteriales bacterium]